MIRLSIARILTPRRFPDVWQRVKNRFFAPAALSAPVRRTAPERAVERGQGSCRTPGEKSSGDFAFVHIVFIIA